MSTRANPETPTRIAIVLGSSRGQRLGERVTQFVLSCSTDVTDAEFTLLDPASYKLPFFDEAIAPWNNPDRQSVPNVQRCLDDVTRADGCVHPVPEYNYAVPAVVKNALDLLGHEAEGKPASIVSYPDTANGGNIAGHELRLTLNKLGMFPMPKSVPLAHAERLFDRKGHLVDDSGFGAKVAKFLPWSLAEPVRYASALRSLRQPTIAPLAARRP